jgi:hypothetical protein
MPLGHNTSAGSCPCLWLSQQDGSWRWACVTHHAAAVVYLKVRGPLMRGRMSSSKMDRSYSVRLVALLRWVSVPLQAALPQQLAPDCWLRLYSPVRALPVLRMSAPGVAQGRGWKR